MFVLSVFIFENGQKDVKAATMLENGVEVEGCSTNGSVETFKYRMPASGYVYFVGKAINYYDLYREKWETINDTLKIGMVIKHKYKTVFDEETNWAYADVLNYSKTCISSKIAVKKGDIITIDISADDLVPNKQKSYFTIKPVFKKINNFEVENNNKKKTASKLKLKKTYTGLVSSIDDDYFVYTAKKSGYYKIKAVATDLHYLDTHIETNVYVGKKNIATNIFRKGDGWKTIAGKKVKLKKGQKIYVKISYGPYSWLSNAYTYKVRINKV